MNAAPVDSTSDGHGQRLGSWQSSFLSTRQRCPSISFSACPLGRGKALSCPLDSATLSVHFFLCLSHGSWQSSFLSTRQCCPSISFSACPMGRGKALSYPLGNVVRPFLSLSAPSHCMQINTAAMSQVYVPQN